MVYFAHGQESGPWGTKIGSLAKTATNQGFAVERPDYSGIMSPDKRVSRLLELSPKSSRKLILAGSSMGAWVSAEGFRYHLSGRALSARSRFLHRRIQRGGPRNKGTGLLHHPWMER